MVKMKSYIFLIKWEPFHLTSFDHQQSEMNMILEMMENEYCIEMEI